VSAASTLAALSAAIDRAPLGARPPMEAARRALAEALGGPHPLPGGWTTAAGSMAALDAAAGALRAATEAAEALTLAPHRGAVWPALRWGERGDDGGAWRGGLATLDTAHRGRTLAPSAALAAWGVTLAPFDPTAASVLAALEGWAVCVEAVTPGAVVPRVSLRAPGGAVVAEALMGEKLPASAPLLRVTARGERRGAPEALTLECVPHGRSASPGWVAWRWRAQLAREALRASTLSDARARMAVLASLAASAEALAQGGDTTRAALTRAERQLADATAAAEHFAALYPGP